MSVFTPLSETTVLSWITQYGFELCSIQEIEGGVSNSVYQLNTRQGEKILILYEQLDLASVKQLAQLQQSLYQENIPVARIEIDHQNQSVHELEQKPAIVFELIEGKHPHSINSQLCFSIGQLLARLHCSTISFTRKNPRGIDWINETYRLLKPVVDNQTQTLIEQEFDFLSRFSLMQLPASIIHADLFADNLLVKDNQIVGIIDFDFACHDVSLLDVAIAINAFCSLPDGSLNRLLMRDLLQGYASIKPLSEQENQAIPMMLRFAALRFWLSRLYDSHFPNPARLLLIKPADEFKQILLQRRQRLSGMQR